MSELHDAVKQCVDLLERHRRRAQRIGEQNTKAGLIEPVIGALGWDLFDPDEVHREYRRRGADNPVDYALLLLRTPRLFIEAKGLGENLDDPRWANQTISYAAVAGVEWVALTDGSEWRVYNAHAPVPIEQKLFRAVRLEDDVDAVVELLSLLSKDNMRDNRIEELWKGFFVDRQVHAEPRRAIRRWGACLRPCGAARPSAVQAHSRRHSLQPSASAGDLRLPRGGHAAGLTTGSGNLLAADSRKAKEQPCHAARCPGCRNSTRTEFQRWQSPTPQAAGQPRRAAASSSRHDRRRPTAAGLRARCQLLRQAAPG